MSKLSRSLPVLMYHYISRHPGAISVNPEVFEAQCKAMAQAGWRGVSLDEATPYLRGTGSLPHKSLLITFDDGYLDNYVYAWPILKRYGHCGVVFAVTERLEKEELVRPTLQQVWDGVYTQRELPAVDNPLQAGDCGYKRRKDLFFSWKEARLMQTEGSMAIAAHSARHRAVFSAPEWTTLRKPQDQLSTFFAEAAHGQALPWGFPVLKERPLLHSRPFYPSPLLHETVCHLVPQEPEEAEHFLAEPTNIEQVEKKLRAIPREQLGKYASDAEWHEQIRDELALCYSRLQHELGHPVSSLCWPWGGYGQTSLNIARDIGFSEFFTTKMGANPPGCGDSIRRFKVRNKVGSWLQLRLQVYANPLLASWYTRLRI